MGKWRSGERRDVRRSRSREKQKKRLYLSKDASQIFSEISFVLRSANLNQSPGRPDENVEVEDSDEANHGEVRNVRPVQLGGVVEDDHGNNGADKDVTTPHQCQDGVLDLLRHLVLVGLEFGELVLNRGGCLVPLVNQDGGNGEDRGDEPRKDEVSGTALNSCEVHAGDDDPS